jgi:putative transposase
MQTSPQKVARTTVYAWKPHMLSEEDQKAVSRRKKEENAVVGENLRADLQAQVAELQKCRDELERKVMHLQMERSIIEAAVKTRKKDMGIDMENLSNMEKAMAVDAVKGKCRLNDLLNALYMAKSSCFYQRRALRRDKHAEVRKTLQCTFPESYECYGCRRMKAALSTQGVSIS